MNSKYYRLKRKIKRFIRSLYRDYPEYKMLNGIKVRYNSRFSVNGEDALRANFKAIKECTKAFKK